MTRLDRLKHSGTSYILNGIMDCFDNGELNKEEIVELERLTNDKRVIGGRPIAWYSIAVLDRLKIKKYAGNDAEIIYLIKNMK